MRFCSLLLPPLFFLCTLFPARSAEAWGSQGHQITGEIAWHLLTPEAEAAVLELLVSSDYGTLAETATWADTYARSKPKYRYAKKLHFVNVPASSGTYVGSRHCRRKCVVSAIRQYARVLKDPAAEREERVEALRFLVHFVGDLHQPLHVAHPDGLGGNKTTVEFFGKKQKAHRVWDTLLIREMIDGAIPSVADDFEADLDWYRQGWRWLAFQVRQDLSPADQKAWSTLDPGAWANETLAVAKQHAFLSQDEEIGSSYVREKSPVVEEQLLKSGVRLAALLNVIFSDRALPRTFG